MLYTGWFNGKREVSIECRGVLLWFPHYHFCIVVLFVRQEREIKVVRTAGKTDLDYAAGWLVQWK